MQLSRKAKIIGIIGTGLLVGGYVIAALIGRDFNKYYTDPICGQPRDGSPPTNCTYEIIRETRHQGLFGFRNSREREIFYDADLNGTPEIYAKYKVDYENPYYVLEAEEDLYAPLFKHLAPEDSRQMTLEEGLELFRIFHFDILPHLPQDDPYLAALSDKK